MNPGSHWKLKGGLCRSMAERFPASYTARAAQLTLTLGTCRDHNFDFWVRDHGARSGPVIDRLAQGRLRLCQPGAPFMCLQVSSP